ncbi:unnamed protein product [Owenia fusiformis]|uniref:Ig-like domain-containing protein n=1 Tax=Owenia fusiformis TaxID=6347 RepID=A0A8S4PYI6_OWEFU|nr:unnamed protein product [Owenia fusiformis]
MAYLWNQVASAFFISICILNIILHSAHGEQSFRTQPHDSEVIHGQTVILPCEVNNAVGMVQWTQDKFALGTERDLPGYPRYSIIGSQDLGEYNLMISNAQLMDDGVWECQVTPTEYTIGLRSEAAKLTVFVPPDEPTIDGEPNVEVTATQPVNLTCTANNGKPAAKISWYTDGELITGNIHTVTTQHEDGKRENVVSTLEITPTVGDQGKTYECQATNEALVSVAPKKTRGSLEVLYAPEVSMTVEPNREMKEGGSVNFKCQAEGNPNTITWKWFEDMEELPDSSQDHFTLKNIDKSKHGKKISCEATNSVGSSKQSFLLNVEYGPFFTGNPQHAAVDVGEDATLQCNVEGNPPPTIIWMRKGSNKIRGSASKMTITNVRESDFGVYTCAATVIGFDEISTDVFLMKNGPPIIQSEDEQFAMSGSEALIECAAQSVPKPSEIKWFKDGSPIDFTNTARYSLIEKDTPTLRKSIVKIEGVSSEDFGEFNCTVSNGYGEDMRLIALVEKEGVPLIYLLAGVLGGIVFIAVIVGIIYCVIRRKRGLPKDDDDASVAGKIDGVVYKPATYGDKVEPWRSDADKSYFRYSDEYAELNYASTNKEGPQKNYGYGMDSNRGNDYRDYRDYHDAGFSEPNGKSLNRYDSGYGPDYLPNGNHVNNPNPNPNNEFPLATRDFSAPQNTYSSMDKRPPPRSPIQEDVSTLMRLSTNV